MSRRHRRDVRRIAPLRGSVKLGHARPFGGHHAIAKDRAARRRGQCPKPRATSRAVGAQRRGIDGAEHSSRIDCVMAALRLRERQNYAPAARTNLMSQVQGVRDVSDPPGRGADREARGGGGSLTSRLCHSNRKRARLRIAARERPTPGPYDAQVQSHVWVAADRAASADVSSAPESASATRTAEGGPCPERSSPPSSLSSAALPITSTGC